LLKLLAVQFKASKITLKAWRKLLIYNDYSSVKWFSKAAFSSNNDILKRIATNQ